MILFRHSDLVDKTKRSAKAFQIRTSCRQSNRFGLAILEHLPEAGCEQWISVHNDVSGIKQEAIEGVRQIAGHLPHPDLTRLSRKADDLHLSRFEAYHEQDVVANDSRKGQDFDVEEVDTGQNLPMCCKKALPGRSRPLTLRRWFNAMVIKDTLYRVSVHGDSGIVHRIPDPGVSPRFVLVRHFHDKIGDFVSRPWPARASLGSSIVFSGHKAPEPAQKRIRRDNSSELLKSLPSESFCLDSQSTPLPISESKPVAYAKFLVHTDLFDEIIDDLHPVLLIPVDPAGCELDEES